MKNKFGFGHLIAILPRLTGSLISNMAVVITTLEALTTLFELYEVWYVREKLARDSEVLHLYRVMLSKTIAFLRTLIKEHNHTMHNNSRQIAVVGCGVSGLTCGLSLLENGCNVKILARELPPKTTSDAAGAFWSPHGTEPGECVRTWTKIRAALPRSTG